MTITQDFRTLPVGTQVVFEGEKRTTVKCDVCGVGAIDDGTRPDGRKMFLHVVGPSPWLCCVVREDKPT